MTATAESNPGYHPDDDATLPQPWDIVRLSQRDVSAQIPINYLPHVSVSLRAACFSHHEYDRSHVTKCVSNLLAAGYRRFFIDAYWDENSREWGLCPLGKKTSERGAKTGGTQDTSEDQSKTNSTRQRRGIEEYVVDSISMLEAREEETRRDEVVSKRKHYSCDTAMNLDVLLQLFEYYMSYTENTLDAHLLYLIFNLYSTKPAGSSSSKRRIATRDDSGNQTVTVDDSTLDTPSSPNTSPAKGTDGLSQSKPKPSPSASTDREAALPGESEQLSRLINKDMLNHLYTPKQLQSDRANLNKSWFAVPQVLHPIVQYFTLEDNGGHLPYMSSPDGWPAEGYLMGTLGKRALVAFGHAEGKMGGYNFTADEEVIFPRGTLAENANITLSGHDRRKHISSGCLFNESDATVNKSLNKWWVSSLIDADNYTTTIGGLGDDDEDSDDEDGDTADFSPTLLNDINSCGVSVYVNSTLSNATAAANASIYLDVVRDSIWSWAPGEPSTSGSSSSTLEDGRCAALDTTKNGHWRARDCSFHFYGACRVQQEPYGWVLTSKRDSYEHVGQRCPANSSFGVPRTPLENAYLYAHVLGVGDKVIDPDDGDATKHSVWVDFNAIDVGQCWVVGHGAAGKAQCPYNISPGGVTRRNVIIPTVAALIALAITALMMLAKCNVNRRNSRRRRVIEGWEYEGVPA